MAMQRLNRLLLAGSLLMALPWQVSLYSLPGGPPPAPAGFALIPAGRFEMGDHQGFVDPKHGGDEIPIHAVQLDSFYMGIYDVTTLQYCGFLNAQLAQRTIEVRQGGIYLAGGKDLLCETRALSPYSRIGWDGKAFSVLEGKEDHPIVCIRWEGAAAYCNWLSVQQKLSPCYDPITWACDFSQNGFRLPTEAEWEYAARGGLQDPYRIFPWGDEADATRANWPESKNPFREGPEPWTTPVGFYSGKLQRKADFGWPGSQESFQTGNGANGFGLYDMSGNVWQYVNDWYGRDYYAVSPVRNPTGPVQGSPMPDGKAYRGMRGGNWYNGENGHGRVSNRNPSYYRGPDDPNHPYYHLGFRVVWPVAATTTGTPAAASFVLRSPEVTDGGTLPAEFTADGTSATLPLSWAGAPAGTKSYALIMHHVDPNGLIKWYWLLYDIPADVQALPKNVQSIGTLGGNSENNRLGYAPPQSQGPGPKTYVYTLYALSAAIPLGVPPARATRDTLLAAMKGRILASATLSVVYSRPGGQAQAGQGGGRTAGAGQAPGAPAAGPAAMPENRTPVSPNPGQTIGLFLDKPGSFQGYTLFAPKHNTVIYLLDNEGRAVHQWKSAYEPGQSVYLKPNGNLVHCCLTKNEGFIGGGEGGRIEEFDWDGNLIWEFGYSSSAYLAHHDIALLPNGNILMLVVEKKTLAECVAAGFNPQMLRDGQLYPDSVVEVQPTYPKGGKIVWEWRVWDHLIQDNDRTKQNYGEVASHPELVDVDANGRAVPAFWNHMNSIAYNATLDQVLLSVRGSSEIWILDHGTTTAEAAGHSGGKRGKGGDLLYRWGNPSAYGRGNAADAPLVQQHDAEWIPEGYPGAGHIMIFNNGYDRGWSSIEEIVPPIDAAGNYILATGKAYGPEKPVWHYEAANRSDFFSSEISGASRLPNGNTLICAGVTGNLFEVTSTGETVWQYVNPVVRDGILAQGELPGKDVRGHLFNAVFKVHRYAPDFPGFSGRDLSPKGVIELPASEKGKTGLDGLDEQPDERRDPPGTAPKGGQAGGSDNRFPGRKP